MLSPRGPPPARRLNLPAAAAAAAAEAAIVCDNPPTPPHAHSADPIPYPSIFATPQVGSLRVPSLLAAWSGLAGILSIFFSSATTAAGYSLPESENNEHTLVKASSQAAPFTA
jgi:hypothetical protein